MSFSSPQPGVLVVNVDVDTVLKNADNLHINYAALPKGAPWALSPTRCRIAAASSVLGTSYALGRETTQAETDAIAYHHAKKIATPSWSMPFILGASWLGEKNGRSKWRFPGSTPSTKFNPDKFLFLRGLNARRAWHTTRFFSYLVLTSTLMGVVVGSYASTVYMANMTRDPRLNGLRDDLERKGIKSLNINVVDSGTNKSAAASDTMTEPAQDAQDFPATFDRQTAVSPLDGIRWKTGSSGQNSSFDNIPERRDSSSDTQDTFGDFPSSDGDFSGSQQNAGAAGSTTTNSNQQSSAWDRIRNQARTNTSKTQTQQGQSSGDAATMTGWAARRAQSQMSQGAKDGTSYNYTQADEEQAYAKAQAQKEFDAMLESERRAGSQGGDKYK